MKKKIVVVINIAGLSPYLLSKENFLPNITSVKKRGTYRKMIPILPAVTCSMQATLLTGKPPADHGIVGNGYFDRKKMKTEFWPQESSLVNGPRIWDIMKERDPNSKIAVLFWQNSKYINADIVITPAPLHTEQGIIEWCYSKPVGYYEELVRQVGEFSLRSYWGPLAGAESSRWIVNSAILTLRKHYPDMLFVYIPHLDYICQRERPDSPAVEKELNFVDSLVGEFLEFREEYGREKVVLFIVSEYGLIPVEGAVFVNRILREAGFLRVREIAGGEYIDFELSQAFAVVDHQIAHIYCKKQLTAEVHKLLEKISGIETVLDFEGKRRWQINHERSGELVAIANPDRWFAYYYWMDDAYIPFYARTVDIHNKPGYDPCELFIDMQTKAIPLKPELVRGSHGIVKEDDRALAVMICSEPALDDYAPTPFNACQFLAMLYRVI